MLWMVKGTNPLMVFLAQLKSIAELVGVMEKAQRAVIFLSPVVAMSHSVEAVRAVMSPTTAVVQHSVIAIPPEVMRYL